MRLIKILMAIMALVSFSCKTTNKEKALKLEQEQFYETLSAIHEFEGSIDYRQFRKKELTVKQMAFYDSLFESNKISQEDFLDEYDTYLSYHPEKLDTIYTRMIDEFETKKDSLKKIENLKKQNKKKPIDSLQKQDLIKNKKPLRPELELKANDNAKK